MRVNQVQGKKQLLSQKTASDRAAANPVEVPFCYFDVKLQS